MKIKKKKTLLRTSKYFLFIATSQPQLTHTHVHIYYLNITTPKLKAEQLCWNLHDKDSISQCNQRQDKRSPGPATITQRLDNIHIKSCARGRRRLSHYSAYFITAVTNTQRRGGIEVAIFRACVSALFEGDFGLARVVIGYTYKCIFLPLPHVLSKALYCPDPLLFSTLVAEHDYISDMSERWSEWAEEWRNSETDD